MPLLAHGSYLRHNLALDVGTACIRIGTGGGRVVESPSVADNKPALQGGVVVDGEALVSILNPLLAQGRSFGVVKPRVLACAPTDVRRHERELLVDSIFSSGAASVVVIPEPLAAAVGAGVEIASAYSQMIVDVGEGVTDCAVIRSGKVVATCAVRTACSGMRAGIAAASRFAARGNLTDQEADSLLRSHGVLHAELEGQQRPHFAVTAAEPVMARIAETVSNFLRDLPAALACDVIDSGIWLSGGGALVPGVRQRLQEATGVRVMRVENPRRSVVEGARLIMPVVTALNQW